MFDKPTINHPADDEPALSTVKSEAVNFQTLYERNKSSNEQLMEQVINLRHMLDLLLGSQQHNKSCRESNTVQPDSVLEALFKEADVKSELLSELNNQLSRLRSATN